jgi:hypothetical protein
LFRIFCKQYSVLLPLVVWIQKLPLILERYIPVIPSIF